MGNRTHGNVKRKIHTGRCWIDKKNEKWRNCEEELKKKTTREEGISFSLSLSLWWIWRKHGVNWRSHSLRSVSGHTHCALHVRHSGEESVNTVRTQAHTQNKQHTHNADTSLTPWYSPFLLFSLSFTPSLSSFILFSSTLAYPILFVIRIKVNSLGRSQIIMSNFFPSFWNIPQKCFKSPNIQKAFQFSSLKGSFSLYWCVTWLRYPVTPVFLVPCNPEMKNWKIKTFTNEKMQTGISWKREMRMRRLISCQWFVHNVNRTLGKEITS